MSDAFVPNSPEAQMALWMQRMEERIRMLETASPLRNSSIRGGALTIREDDGQQTGRFGIGTYANGDGDPVVNTVLALNQEDTDNLLFLWDAEHGQVTPTYISNWTLDDYVTITGASYGVTWKTLVPCVGLVLIVQVLVVVAPGTTGSLKLNFNGQDSGVYALADGSNQYYTWYWDVSSFTTLTTVNPITVQAKVDTGAGGIFVYAPSACAVGAIPLYSNLATSDGLP